MPVRPKTPKTPALNAVVGANLRRLREAEGLNQGDVADRVRALGLPWTRSVIASVEAGGRSLGLDEMAVLSLAMRKPPSEFLVGNGQVAGASGVTLDLNDLRATLTKEPSARDIAKAASTLEALAGGIYDPEIVALGEPEQAASKRLGVSATDIARMALKRWGQSLTAERDTRVLARTERGVTRASQQAIRGHVTRVLLDELRDELGSRRVSK